MAVGRRTCVFCGNPPDSKTLEHVIPLWLIKHTGDPKRIVFHGHFGKRPVQAKIFSFDQYRFPACRSCNERWGVLEEEAKRAVLAMEAEEPVSDMQISSLLDWFDKVRVGLWLSRQLDGSSIALVDPKFHIDQRVGASDRLLYVSKGAESKALTTIGVGGAVFGFMPSVFALRINSLMFFNASAISLFGHRLGFPKMQDSRIKIADEWRYAASVEAGTGAVRAPLVQLGYPLPALKLYQPMYRYLNTHHLWQDHYRQPYVLENSLDWSVGEGAIFEEHSGKATRIESLTSVQYERSHVNEGLGLLDDVNRATANWQRQLSKSGVRGDIDTPERKARYQKVMAKARKLDTKLWKPINKNSRSIP